MSTKAPWITSRPELKVMDCTIRDGGLVNDSNFTDDQVKAVYDACVEGGLDYMEIGYLNSEKSFPKSEYGPWRHCHEEDLRRVVGDHDPEKTGMKLSVMVDAGGKSDWKNALLPKSESVISLARIACYATQISEAAEMIEHAHSLGYETNLNLMAVSTLKEVEIDKVLEIARGTPAQVVVVVDSNGSLYREQVDHLVTKYRKALEGTDKLVGIHAHNNLQLAFANTIEAIILGCNRVDSTMLGFGRGAGNCNTELLLTFLRNPKFHLRPILKCIQEQILPLKQKLDWGPSFPYTLTGSLNAHPRSAMAFRDGPTPNDYVEFYDQMVTDS